MPASTEREINEDLARSPSQGNLLTVWLVVIFALLLVLSGAGANALMSSSSQPESPRSVPAVSVTEVPTEDEVEEFRSRIVEELKPCTPAVNSMSEGCVRAIAGTVGILGELEASLPDYQFPKTRVSIRQTISDLEYWSESCIATHSNSREHHECGPYLPIPARAENPVWELTGELDR